MKDFLKKLIKAKEQRAAELRNKIKESQDVNEVRSLGDTLEAVLAELAEAKAQLDALDEPAADEAASGDAERSGFNPIATMETRNGARNVASDLEYRKAFRNFIATGNRTELREATGNTTGADNVSTVIPEICLIRLWKD